MNGIPELKEGFTQIPNELLVEIIAKGLLNLTEVRITAYIIRFSLGFHRDWTLKTTVKEIANDIGMTRCKLSTALNRMIGENKILRDEGRFKFNEDYKEWKVLPSRNVAEIKEKTDTLEKVLPNSNASSESKALPNRNKKCYQNGTVVLPNSNGEDTDNTEQINAPNTPKYTFKYILNKQERNVKERKIISIENPFLNEKDFKDKEKVDPAPADVVATAPASVVAPAEEDQSPALAKIIFNSKVFKFENIPKGKMEKWKEAFPSLNVEIELKKMEAWLLANPKNKKENYERFIVNWLGRTVPKKETKKVERTGFYDATGRRIN